MVNIETIDLTSRNVVLPSDRVGIVVAQPHLELTASEPFRCTYESKPAQLQVLKETLRVAREAGLAGLRAWQQNLQLHAVGHRGGFAVG